MAGMDIARLSLASGMSRKSLWEISSGRTKRIAYWNEEKILAITLESDPYWAFDLSEAREHLKWLQRNGIGMWQIATRSGVPINTVRTIRDGSKKKTWKGNVEKLLACHLDMFTPQLQRVHSGLISKGLDPEEELAS